MITSREIVICLGLLLAGGPVLGATLKDAAAAFQRGDFGNALSVATPLANAGDPRAQNLLGAMSETGRGLTQDYAQAARWYALAAKAGDADAQGNLGRLYGLGLGVRRDFAEAVKWLSLASAQGSVGARTSLVKIFSDGAQAHVRRDYSAALEMWMPLANAGHPTSRFMIGVMYDNGQGVKQDGKTAAEWYRQAADQGHSTAQFNLAALHMDPRSGVPMDYVQAFKWMTLARLGTTDASVTPKAEEALRYLSSHMTQEQMASGRTLVEMWQAQPALNLPIQPAP